jgi:mono/diheme cytochrome c family protein
MKLLTRPPLGFLCLILLLSVIVAGCAPNANAQLISPELGEQLYAEESDAEIAVEPTPVPRLFAELTPEEVTAGLPEDFAAALANADPSQGESLALVNGCVGCHSVDPAIQMTGPTWSNLADHATNRVPGMSPANYLYTSITNPNSFVVPDYPAGVMLQIYEETIPTQDLANLVAYLLTLHE